MDSKSSAVQKYWRDTPTARTDYSQVDPATLKLFRGTHPRVMHDRLPPGEAIFRANPDYRISSREKKHRFMLKLERWFGLRFDKHHYRMVK